MSNYFYVLEKKNSGARECVELCSAGVFLVPWDKATQFSTWASAKSALNYLDRISYGDAHNDLIVTEHGWTTSDAQAREAFTRYAKAVDGKAHDGSLLPDWDDVPERIRRAWREAVRP